MPDEVRKLIVDDDWKAEAQREKERLAEQTAAAAGGKRGVPTDNPQFLEILNILVMQSLAALGLLQVPGQPRTPPNLEAAKHFIDLLSVLDEKTRGNLSPEEKKTLDQTLYEMRMNFVQISQMLAGGLTGELTGRPPTP